MLIIWIIRKYYISLSQIFKVKILETEQTIEKPVARKASGPNIYLAPDIVKEDELDGLKKIIYLFSCHRKVCGVTPNVLREKLILLLALYIKYGYNLKTKEKAAKILNVKKPAINSMNLELRHNNYLVKDSMNTRINHLHKDLVKLQEYVHSNGENPMLFLFQVVNYSNAEA